MTEFSLSDWHERFKQQLRWTSALRRYLFGQLKIDQRQRVLEIGCGTGALLDELSKTLSSCEFHGLDLRLDFLGFARRNAPTSLLVQGDAHNAPYPKDFFDVSLCHYLLLWVRSPLQVIEEMERVTRPGGYVLALAEPDYGGRVDYPAELQIMGEWQRTALQGQNADPTIGRRLRSLFQQAGLKNVRTGVLGGEWYSDSLSEADLRREWDVLEMDLRESVERGTIEHLRGLDQLAWQRNERILYIPTFYAVGQKPYTTEK